MIKSKRSKLHVLVVFDCKTEFSIDFMGLHNNYNHFMHILPAYGQLRKRLTVAKSMIGPLQSPGVEDPTGQDATQSPFNIAPPASVLIGLDFLNKLLCA